MRKTQVNITALVTETMQMACAHHMALKVVQNL